MSFRITNTTTIGALRAAYNSHNWQQAYRLVLDAITVTTEIPLTDPLSGVVIGSSYVTWWGQHTLQGCNDHRAH